MRYSKRRQVLTTEVGSKPQLASLSFEKALNAFLQVQDSAGHSRVTRADYKTVVGLFLRYMTDTHGYSCVDEITESDLLGWLAHLRNSNSSLGTPYSTRTIATYCRDVLTFFHWLIDHKYLQVDPTLLINEPKVEKALIRVFTDEELKMLDAACDRAPSGRSITPDERRMLAARDRAVLWLLLSTGIRLSELCGLRFCDLDWDKGMVLVKGKGAKERRVPMGTVARQHLNTYIVYWRGAPADTNERVFTTVFGKPVTPSAIKQLFARLKRVVGITDKRVSAHTCRHWFAVSSIKRGVPSVVLQDWLGHEDLKMIKTYIRLAEQDHSDLYAKFSPVDSLEMHTSSKEKRGQLRDWRNSRKKV
jgi:site-specific recombinase XerD